MTTALDVLIMVAYVVFSGAAVLVFVGGIALYDKWAQEDETR